MVVVVVAGLVAVFGVVVVVVLVVTVPVGVVLLVTVVVVVVPSELVEVLLDELDSSAYSLLLEYSVYSLLCLSALSFLY